jgi:putative transcriptional regulator
MAPKSNPGTLDAILGGILVLICMGAGHVSRAANGLPWYRSQPINQPVRSHWTDAVGAKSKTPPAVYVPVQFKDPKNLGVGKLLVASPNLVDPNFAKTVVLLIRSDDEGIVGLILNRRTDLALSRILEGLPGIKDRSDPAYLGGPVQVGAVTALLQSPDKIDGADHVFGAVYLISTKTLLEQTLARRPDPQVFHVYLGYAGWDNDQLRKEVELGAWFIFPGDAAAVFNSDPGSLWPQMIRKTQQKFADSKPGSSHPWTHPGPFVKTGTNPSLEQVARR